MESYFFTLIIEDPPSGDRYIQVSDPCLAKLAAKAITEINQDWSSAMGTECSMSRIQEILRWISKTFENVKNNHGVYEEVYGNIRAKAVISRARHDKPRMTLSERMIDI